MNQIPYGYIYCITNKINGKTYIGSRKLSLDKSWRHYMGSGRLIKQAINKHSVTNFTKTLLEYSYGGEIELKRLEEKYIKDYKKLGKAEYNIYANASSGGDTFQKLKQKTLDEVRAAQSAGVIKAIKNGGGSAKTKANNATKYSEIFTLIGEDIINYYSQGYTLLQCRERFGLPVERMRLYLKNNGVKMRGRRVGGHENSSQTNQKISHTLKNNIKLKSGESLLEAHDRLIKYSYNDLVKNDSLKNIYGELNTSKVIFNRFVRDHEKYSCEYCSTV